MEWSARVLWLLHGFYKIRKHKTFPWTHTRARKCMCKQQWKRERKKHVNNAELNNKTTRNKLKLPSSALVWKWLRGVRLVRSVWQSSGTVSPELSPPPSNTDTHTKTLFTYITRMLLMSSTNESFCGRGAVWWVQSLFTCLWSAARVAGLLLSCGRHAAAAAAVKSPRMGQDSGLFCVGCWSKEWR